MTYLTPRGLDIRIPLYDVLYGIQSHACHPFVILSYFEIQYDVPFTITSTTSPSPIRNRYLGGRFFDASILTPAVSPRAAHVKPHIFHNDDVHLAPSD